MLLIPVLEFSETYAAEVVSARKVTLGVPMSHFQLRLELQIGFETLNYLIALKQSCELNWVDQCLSVKGEIRYLTTQHPEISDDQKCIPFKSGSAPIDQLRRSVEISWNVSTRDRPECDFGNSGSIQCPHSVFRTQLFLVCLNHAFRSELFDRDCESFQTKNFGKKRLAICWTESGKPSTLNQTPSFRRFSGEIQVTHIQWRQDTCRRSFDGF